MGTEKTVESLTERDPNFFGEMISKALRLGVVLSAAVILSGMVLLLLRSGTADISNYLAYDPSMVPHGQFRPDLASVYQGLFSLEPFSIVMLGALLLLATPVARVGLSLVLFAFERDRAYVIVTIGVLSLLLFSMFVTPFIPGFNT